MLALRKKGLVMIAGTTNSTVVPSGAAFAAASWPTLPPAPPRFSTTAGCPRRSASLLDTMRVTTSAGPPGGNGTIQRIGFEGQPPADCACAKGPASSAAPAQTAARNLAFMVPPQWSVRARPRYCRRFQAASPPAHEGAPARNPKIQRAAEGPLRISGEEAGEEEAGEAAERSSDRLEARKSGGPKRGPCDPSRTCIVCTHSRSAAAGRT